MTATEELRRMLDERGVEWDELVGHPVVVGTAWYDRGGCPCTALEHADDVPDGMLSVQANLTPAQAIAATLGVTDATGERHGGASTLTAENAKLREQLDTARHNQVRNAREYARLCHENDSLRELVRFIMHQCNDGNPRCDECIDWNGGECVALQRMRELEIEVDG